MMNLWQKLMHRHFKTDYAWMDVGPGYRVVKVKWVLGAPYIKRTMHADWTPLEVCYTPHETWQALTPRLKLWHSIQDDELKKQEAERSAPQQMQLPFSNPSSANWTRPLPGTLRQQQFGSVSQSDLLRMDFEARKNLKR